MKHIAVVALVMMQVTTAQCVGKFAWRNVGPGGGGWIESVAMHPTDTDTIYVGCDVGGFYKSTDGGKSFVIHNAGLNDYFIERIVVDPTDPDVIYVATWGGVHKSTDGGITWMPKRKGFPPPQEYRYSAPVGPLVMDPKDHNVLYAGIGDSRRNKYGRGHIYKSTDAGESWTLLDGIAKIEKDAVMHQLAIRPDDSKVIFAATDKGLFKSADGGLTWERKEKGLPHRFCRNVAIHPRKPDVMYAVMWSTPGVKPWHGGVYRSDDGGESWSARNEGLPQKVAPPGDAPQKTCNFIRLLLDPRDPERLFVGSNSWWGAGLYRSTDGGRHWEMITRKVAKWRTASGEEYFLSDERASEMGLSKRDIIARCNMELGWITMGGIPSIKCIAHSPSRPDTIVFGTSMTLFRTDDYGEHWKQIYCREVSRERWQGNGLEVTCLPYITVDPKDSRRIYCGYMDIGVMVTDDGGRSWRRMLGGLPAHGDGGEVLVDPDRPADLWCTQGRSKDPGVWKSTDRGESWVCIGSKENGLPPSSTHSAVLNPTSPVGGRTLYVATRKHGVYKLKGAAGSWAAMNRGLGVGEIIEVTDLVIDPKNPQRLFAAVKWDEDDPVGGFYVTDDGGENWRKANRDVELPDIRSIAVDPGRPTTVFVACRRHYSHKLQRMWPGGIFRSKDGGRTWECVFEDRFASCVRISPFNSKVIYIGTTNHPYHDDAIGRGAFVSRDGGNSWTPINKGLTCHRVSVITLDPSNRKRIYAGTGGNGLFIGEWK